ncbi:MAG: hypothetical protein HC841_01735, partial [Verrucomicrobiae bacterium]|nr:hypothetical protein [Verrucomicrobiae bacterium]
MLLLSLGCLTFSGWKYFRHESSGEESWRFDTRAIGEALRVQFYWLLTGTGRVVSSDYMQRQRDELDWIRYIVSSLAIPAEAWRREFLGLDHNVRFLLLKAAHKRVDSK